MITNAEMVNALFRSGYLLENRLISRFGKLGYEVYQNPTYEDPFTKKSRELDLMTEKFEVLSDRELKAVVQTKFIVEAMNNPVPIAFFKNKFQALDFEDHQKVKYIVTPELKDLDHFIFKINLGEFHHSLDSIPSTQYCSFSKKKEKDSEWMASHPDGMHDVLGKLYHFTKMTAETKTDSPLFTMDSYSRLFFLQPLVVIQGDMYEVNVVKSGLKLDKKNHIKFQFNYTFGGDSDCLLIDFVQEKYLETYLKEIEIEEKEAFSRLKCALTQV